MHFPATTKAEYLLALEQYMSGTIVGQHTIGDIGVMVSHRGTYTIVDGANTWNGKGRSLGVLTSALDKNISKCIHARFPANA